jgi:DNA invertase Pin-like site-specific DNA recombinase
VLTGYLPACNGHGTELGAHRWALADARCGQVVEERAAGKDGGAQPELSRLLRRPQPGDSVVVPQMDSLAGSLPDLVGTLRRTAAAGAGLRSLAEALDAGTSQKASPNGRHDEAAAALSRPNLQDGHGLPERVEVGHPATPPPI